MKLILHIGRPKTGSTALQQSLVRNRVRLEQGGFYVSPELLGGRNNTKIAAYLGAKGPHYETRFGPGTARLADFGREFSELVNKVSTDYDSFIISSEFFARLRKSEEIKKVKAFLDDHFSSIEVVSYFREQANLIPSSYSQCVKAGETRTFDQFIAAAPYKKGLLYSQFADAWRTGMGDAKLNMRLFFPTSWSILDDFWSDVLLLEAPAGPIRNNLALSAKTAERFRQINKSFPYVTKRKSISKLNLRLKAVSKRLQPIGAAPLVLREEEAIRIREIFNEDNQFFAQTFHPSGYAALQDFDTRWQGPGTANTGRNTSR